MHSLGCHKPVPVLFYLRGIVNSCDIPNTSCHSCAVLLGLLSVHSPHMGVKIAEYNIVPDSEYASMISDCVHGHMCAIQSMARG